MAAAYQFLSTPAKLPKQWQPRLNEWSVYHCSHPDVAQAGWRKWSAEHPDWYAQKASSTTPDWFRRRVNTIRRADYKSMNWHYDLASKPNSRNHDIFVSNTNEILQKDTAKPLPPNRSYQGSVVYPKPFPAEIPAPRWGLYNPHHYEEPTRFTHFPPIKHTGLDVTTVNIKQ